MKEGSEIKFEGSRIKLHIIDYKGKPRVITYEPVLYGIVKGLIKRREYNWHALILITGPVGDGKTTLGTGIAGLDSILRNIPFGIDNIVFSNQKFNENCNRLDNFDESILYDEAIEGTTSRDIGSSSKGIAFKKKVITKRKKRHLYILCIDEIEEYAWKLIKMANCWIHVEAEMLKRGKFSVTIDKEKIKTKYLLLKQKRYEEANKIAPDYKDCTYMNYEDIFFSDDEYQEKKDLETSKDDNIEDNKDKFTEERLIAWTNLKNKGYSWPAIGEIYGMSGNGALQWYKNNKQTNK